MANDFLVPVFEYGSNPISGGFVTSFTSVVALLCKNILTPFRRLENNTNYFLTCKNKCIIYI
jgi:hypothetical protein